MQLLDATLALALTLAALATIVTIIMEMGMRTARMRKKNLVEVMRLLNKELDNGLFKDLDANERWQFICKVIGNPAKVSTDQLPSQLESKSWIVYQRLNIKSKSKQSTEEILGGEPTGTKRKLTDSDLNRLFDFIGYDKSSGKNGVTRFFVFIAQIFGDHKRANLYDKVSLEHVLRRLVEIEKVGDNAVTARKKARAELNRLARKYEEYGSAISASFKRSAQAWSIGVGILFAIVANVDGLRIFDAYRTDPDLVKTIIEQQQGLIASYTGIEQRQQQYSSAQKEFKDAQTEVSRAEDALASAKTESEKSELEQTLNAKQIALSQAQAKLNVVDSVNQIQQNTEQAQQQLGKLVAIGVPIGWTFYPNCPDPESGETWKSSDPRCRSFSRQNYWQRAGTFLQWLFAVVLTGFLIGLGAPFWYDVAKRLAQVRQGLRQNASDEISMSGNNANGNNKVRKRIVKSVVNDVAQEKRSQR